MAHWVSMRYGISWWKADRWVKAAHALESLPLIAQALSSGVLSIDKVVELTRFATSGTEERLIRWAEGVSAAAIRRRGDVESRPAPDDAAAAERDRCVEWWWAEGGLRLGLQAELPAADGAAVIAAIERRAARVPVTPGEEDPLDAPARRADALVALCTHGSEGPRTESTIVVHVQAGSAVENGELEGGGVIHPAVLERLCCTEPVRAVVEDGDRNPLALGRTSREPSVAMMRALRYRDRECRFPGCGATRFTVGHHLKWWSKGGRTDLENLLLLCTFHHKLVHEHGWHVARAPDGTVHWSYPSGIRYRAGPTSVESMQQELVAVG
jgi:hypothetical protein